MHPNLELKNSVLQRSEITSIISRFVKLQRVGNHYLGLCPFHAEKSPSFNVSKKRQFFKCFGCGTSGDAVAFVMKIKRLGFTEALHEIAKMENLPLIENQLVANATSYLTSKNFIKRVDTQVFRKTLKNYDENVFVLFLEKTFGLEAVIDVLAKYCIGTAKGGGTIFWQVDAFKRPRTAQKIFYGTNGRRIKEKPPVRLFTVNEGYSPCFFGEHLLKSAGPEDLVGIVEAEKTAVIASIKLSTIQGKKVHWLAASGNNGITEAKAQALKGRHVVLCPDFSFLSRAVWGLVPMRRDKDFKMCGEGEIDIDYESRADMLKKLGCAVSFLDPCPDVMDNTDLADFILQQPEEPEQWIF